MGLVIIAKGADFSGVSICNKYFEYHFGTIPDLTELFETRLSISEALTNKMGTTRGVLFGAPTFQADSMVSDAVNGIRFLSKPYGSHTIAVVFKNRPGAITNSYPAGSISANIASKGGSYFLMDSTNINLAGLAYNPDGSYDNTYNAYLAKEAGNTFELYIGRFTNGVGIQLDHPKTGQTAIAATTKNFNMPDPDYYCAGARYPNIVEPTDNVTLFAHWSRAITDDEIVAFYNAAKSRLADYSITI